MSKEEIVAQIREWIAEGKLLSKAQNGAYYHGFDRKAHKGELFYTEFDSILAIDLETSEKFNSLFWDKRIMKSVNVKCKHRELTNDHLIQKVCMRGEMIKFDEFGKGCVLYIE